MLLPRRKLPARDEPVSFAVPARLPVKARRSEGGGRSFICRDRRQQQKRSGALFAESGICRCVSRGRALPIESREFRVETLGPLPTLWARLRLAFLFKKRKFLKFDEFYLFSVGPKTERRRFTRYNRDMRNIGIEFDSELVASTRRLFMGGRPRPLRRLN